MFLLDRSEDSSYERMTSQNRIPENSVLKKIKLLRSGKNYLLLEKEVLQLQKLLQDKTTQLSRSDDEQTEAVAKEQTKKRKNSSKDLPTPKKKRTNEGKADVTDTNTKKKKKETDTDTKTKKKKKETDKETKTKKKETEIKKKKDTATKTAKPKKEKKPPVDKSDPNWRLKRRNDVTVWEKDPFFETKSDDASFPFVSSTAHSRLAITAVLTKGDIIVYSGDLKSNNWKS